MLFFESLEYRRLLAVDLVSVTPSPAPLTSGDLASTNPMISANGKYVAFQSRATDLAAGLSDVNASEDVFVRDLVSGITIPISVIPGGGRTGDAPSFDPAISDDGRFVTFVSAATNLVTGMTIDSDTNVYVRDRDADENGIYDEVMPGATVTRLLSIASDGGSGNLPSGGGFSPFLGSPVNRPVISGNGSSVAFASFASNLSLDGAQTDGNISLDVFRASTDGGKLTLISVNSDATASCTYVLGDPITTNPSISRTGGAVAFQSRCDNIVTAASGGVDDTNSAADIFVGSGGPATLVSINGDGTGTGDGASREPAISRDGRHVAFISRASDLVRGATDANGSAEDVFVRDLKESRTTLVSRSRAVSSPTTSGNGASPPSATGGEFNGGPVISDSGRFVVFQSAASDLLDPAEGVADTNGQPDLFVFDRDPDRDGVFDEASATRTILVSVDSAGTDSSPSPGGPCSSFAPSISTDGRYVAFASTCTGLIAGVTGANIYVRDLVAGTTALISSTISGGEGGALSTLDRNTSISANGSRLAFISDTLATDLDPVVAADPNSELPDVFVGTPPTDIRLTRNFATGFTTHYQNFSVLFEDSAPFGVGYYDSVDRIFDATDDLLGVASVSDVEDLTVAGNRLLTAKIGGGAGELALPGIATPDELEDYFVLIVGDHLDEVDEFDGDPFNEDNTVALRGLYHVAGGPVFVHGGAGSETLTATSDGTTLTFGFGTTGAIYKYDVADVTDVRVRAHEGNDVITGSDLVDIFFGGEGNDFLDGGGGDDYLDGGPGDDKIFGGPGDDLIFDGCGDDFVDAGPGDNVVMSTPCSDDIFIDGGGNDTIDFSLGDMEITLDLDSTAVQTVDDAGSTIQLVGQWENFVGSPFGNKLTARPATFPRTLRGGDGNDQLLIDALGNPVVNDGTKFSFPGRGLGDITYTGFEHIRVINAAPQIVDNDDPFAFDAPGFVCPQAGFPDPPCSGVPPQGFNGTVVFSGPNSPTQDNTATWTFSDIAPGSYVVSSTWTFAPDRAKDVPYTIRDGDVTGPIVASVIVDQEQDPGEFDPPEDGQNILFRNLAVVRVTGNTLTVQVTDTGADQNVIADAIRIEPVSSTLIIDDGDPEFSSTGNVVPGLGAFGDITSTAAAGNTSGGVWDCTQDECLAKVPAGRYSVSATWKGFVLGASADSTFTVTSGTNSFATNVNQFLGPDGFSQAGTDWQRLGDIDVTSGGGIRVELSGSAGMLLADAIRIDPAPRAQIVDPFGSPVSEGVPVELGDIAIDPTTGAAGVERTFTILNTGLASLIIDDVQATGAGYTVNLPQSFANVLPPGASTTFNVAFTGNALGDHNGGIQVITLDSLGVPKPTTELELNTAIVDDTTPPTVRIVSPDDGAVFIEGTSIPVIIDVDGDGEVRPVDVFIDNILFRSLDRAPFVTEVTLPTGATLAQIGVTAHDVAGNMADATPITVNLVADEPPTLNIVGPRNGQGVIEGSSHLIQVEAEDDVAVRRVEFMVDGVLQDTAFEEPYVGRVQIPNRSGDVNVEVKATDSSGKTTSQFLTLPSFSTPIMDPRSIVSAGAFGADPIVRIFNPDGSLRFQFFPYSSILTSSLHVAGGDINGDGTPDIITGAGTAAGPHVKVFDGVTGGQIRSFFAFTGFLGGVTVAGGDVNGDGRDDIIVGSGAGAPGGHVKVFSGTDNTLLNGFFAFPGFNGGVFVAAGDVNGDAQADIIVGAGAGGEPHVKVFDGHSLAELQSFFAYEPTFTGGVRVAAGNFDDDGLSDIVTGSGPGQSPVVKVFNGTTGEELSSFFAFEESFEGGIFPFTGDFNDDEFLDLGVGFISLDSTQIRQFDRNTLDELGDIFTDGFESGDVSSWALPESQKSPRARVVNLPPAGGTTEVRADGLDLVVQQPGGNEHFRGSQDGLSRLRVNGTPGVDDMLIVNVDGLTKPIIFDGGEGGHDVLRLEGNDEIPVLKYEFFNASDGRIVGGTSELLRGFFYGLEPIEDNLNVIDRIFSFPGTDDAIVFDTGASTMDSIWRISSNNSEVVDFVEPSGTLTIESATNDTVDIGTGWLFDGTAVIDGKFARILTRDGLTLRMIGPHDWSNPVNPLDVNSNGTVEPLDVLNIINELNDPRFHGATGSLTDAAALQLFPDFFFDTNLDGFVVPLDALVIINFLNRFVGGTEGEDLAPAPGGHVDSAIAGLIQFVPRTETLPTIAVAPSRRDPVLPVARAAVPETRRTAPAARQLTRAEYARGVDELLADLQVDTLRDELLRSRSD